MLKLYKCLNIIDLSIMWFTDKTSSKYKKVKVMMDWRAASSIRRRKGGECGKQEKGKKEIETLTLSQRWRSIWHRYSGRRRTVWTAPSTSRSELAGTATAVHASTQNPPSAPPSFSPTCTSDPTWTSTSSPTPLSPNHPSPNPSTPKSSRTTST